MVSAWKTQSKTTTPLKTEKKGLTLCKIIETRHPLIHNKTLKSLFWAQFGAFLFLIFKAGIYSTIFYPILPNYYRPLCCCSFVKQQQKKKESEKRPWIDFLKT